MKESKKLLEALKLAEEHYLQVEEQAILPCSKEIADLKALRDALKHMRLYIVRESILFAEAVRKRENTRDALLEKFALSPQGYTEEEGEQWAIEAEDLLKAVLDSGNLIEALRKLLYYYTFTKNRGADK